MSLSHLIAGCRIVESSPQAKLLRVAQFFLKVQKVMLVIAYHQHANGSDMIKALEQSVNEIAQIVRSQKFE